MFSCETAALGLVETSETATIKKSHPPERIFSSLLLLSKNVFMGAGWVDSRAYSTESTRLFEHRLRWNNRI